MPRGPMTCDELASRSTDLLAWLIEHTHGPADAVIVITTALGQLLALSQDPEGVLDQVNALSRKVLDVCAPTDNDNSEKAQDARLKS